MPRPEEGVAVVLTDDTPFLLALTHQLAKIGPIRTVGFETAGDAFEMILARNPFLVVIDGDMAEASGFLAELDRVALDTPILLVGSVSEDLEVDLEFTVLPKPVSPEQLRLWVEGLPPANRASVETEPPFNLSDYLQLAALGQHSIRFVVVTEEDLPGSIVLENGILRQARYGDLTGMDALRKLLACRLRSFRIQGLRTAIKDGELDLPVARALLDLAVERDMAATGELATEPPAEPGAGPPSDPFLQAMSEGIDASLAGDYVEARKAFLRALEIRPGEPTALHNLRRTEEIIERKHLEAGDNDGSD